MLCILAALLLFVFFLPDLIGPYPALVIGVIVIGFAFFVYNKWSQADPADKPAEKKDDYPE